MIKWMNVFFQYSKQAKDMCYLTTSILHGTDGSTSAIGKKGKTNYGKSE